jgi:hypothetical protein
MRTVSGGWHQPDNLGLYELDALLSPKDTAILQSRMIVGHADRVEFMARPPARRAARAPGAHSKAPLRQEPQGVYALSVLPVCLPLPPVGGPIRVGSGALRAKPGGAIQDPDACTSGLSAGKQNPLRNRKGVSSGQYMKEPLSWTATFSASNDTGES